MDRYATHLEALVATVLGVDGAILELGCGDYSTPVLAAIARAQGRRFLVHAADESWAARYRDIAMIEIVDWSRWEPPPGEWGVVLLDSEESTAGRILHLPKLRAAGAIVVHDADSAQTRRHWAECTEGFRIEWFRRQVPWTAVLRPC